MVPQCMGGNEYGTQQVLSDYMYSSSASTVAPNTAITEQILSHETK